MANLTRPELGMEVFDGDTKGKFEEECRRRRDGLKLARRSVVTLRLTPLESPDGVVMKVDGVLEGNILPGLIQRTPEGNRVFALDLSDLVEADEAGVESLRALRDSGLSLIHVRPFLEALLELT